MGSTVLRRGCIFRQRNSRCRPDMRSYLLTYACVTSLRQLVYPRKKASIKRATAQREALIGTSRPANASRISSRLKNKHQEN